MLIDPLFYRYAGAPMIALMTCVLAGTGLALAGLGSSLRAVELGYGGLFGIFNGLG